jgi:hypothetical protein
MITDFNSEDRLGQPRVDTSGNEREMSEAAFA